MLILFFPPLTKYLSLNLSFATNSDDFKQKNKITRQPRNTNYVGVFDRTRPSFMNTGAFEKKLKTLGTVRRCGVDSGRVGGREPERRHVNLTFAPWDLLPMLLIHQILHLLKKNLSRAPNGVTLRGLGSRWGPRVRAQTGPFRQCHGTTNKSLK